MDKHGKAFDCGHTAADMGQKYADDAYKQSIKTLSTLPAKPMSEEEIAHKLYMEAPSGTDISKAAALYAVKYLRDACVLYVEEK